MTLDRTQKFAMSTGGQGVSVGDVADFVGGSSGSVKTVRVAVSNAQLLALNLSPVEIVPAPGPGLAIQIIATSYNYTYGTTTFATQGDEALYFRGSEQSADSGSTNVFSGTASLMASAGIGQGGTGLISIIENTAVVLLAPTQDMTDGDGTAVITVQYVIIAL